MASSNHDDDTPCRYCKGTGRRFDSADRPWKCDYTDCHYHSKGFLSRNDLDRHVDVVHNLLNRITFQCPMCEYSCSQEYNCKAHMARKHGWTYDRNRKRGQNEGPHEENGPIPVPPSSDSALQSPAFPQASPSTSQRRTAAKLSPSALIAAPAQHSSNSLELASGGAAAYYQEPDASSKPIEYYPNYLYIDRRQRTLGYQPHLGWKHPSGATHNWAQYSPNPSNNTPSLDESSIGDHLTVSYGTGSEYNYDRTASASFPRTRASFKRGRSTSRLSRRRTKNVNNRPLSESDVEVVSVNERQGLQEERDVARSSNLSTSQLDQSDNFQCEESQPHVVHSLGFQFQDFKSQDPQSQSYQNQNLLDIALLNQDFEHQLPEAPNRVLEVPIAGTQAIMTRPTGRREQEPFVPNTNEQYPLRLLNNVKGQERVELTRKLFLELMAQHGDDPSEALKALDIL